MSCEAGGGEEDDNDRHVHDDNDDDNDQVRVVLYWIPGCFNSLLTSGELQLVSALSLTSSSLSSQSVLDTYTHTLLSALAATQSWSTILHIRAAGDTYLH